MQYYFTADDRSTFRWDLGARTDGQPVYSGRLENPPAGLTSAQLEEIPLWIIHYHEYTTVGGLDNLTSKKLGIGKWSERVTTVFR